MARDEKNESEENIEYNFPRFLELILALSGSENEPSSPDYEKDTDECDEAIEVIDDPSDDPDRICEIRFRDGTISDRKESRRLLRTCGIPIDSTHEWLGNPYEEKSEGSIEKCLNPLFSRIICVS